jgi:hypothetical protein
MGTRADFYDCQGAQATWLGSVTWDGYPDGFESDLFAVENIDAWKNKVREMLESRDDATFPSEAERDDWPWPWDDSSTTDFAYCFIDQQGVMASYFGSQLFNAGHALEHPEQEPPSAKLAVEDQFPDMSHRRQPIDGVISSSGLTILQVPR